MGEGFVNHNMKRIAKILLLAVCATILTTTLSAKDKLKEVDGFTSTIRPPATPLITIDPYFSLWSLNDNITDDVTRHWTRWKQPLLAVLRVDGKLYRVVGKENANPVQGEGDPAHPERNPELDPYYNIVVPECFPLAAQQISCNVLPTSTIYEFRCGPVILELSFTSPVVLDDVDLLARPVTYLSANVRSRDAKKHAVSLYLEASARFAINLDVVPVDFSTNTEEGVSYASVGTVEQDVLGRRGDDVRIDWGYFYLASHESKGSVGVAKTTESRRSFCNGDEIKFVGGELRSDNFVTDDLSLVYSIDLGKVGKKSVSDYVMLAYDDIYSIKYLKEWSLRPWWNSDGNNTIIKELSKASAEYESVISHCKAFDKKIIDDAMASGGQKYADLCALAYRQAITAHKLVASPKGEMFFFSKENFSNGCCGTVDVTYPSIPLFLLYNNDIAKSLIDFIFDYCESPLWTRTWAAHDVGVYPDAYGQHYGNHMKLEECGNMLLLTAAIVKNGAGAEYALKHWKSLTMWALYAVQNGQMPESQLCTDDFAGKLAYNVNLSAKSILGVAAYADMAKMLGKEDEAYAYRRKAEEMAQQWKTDAFLGDHYVLAFGSDSTWSIKYNLVWDELLGLNLFGREVIDTELDYYKGKFNQYGLPLDSRKGFTKTDWELWMASMARSDEEFALYVDHVWKFYNETVDRVPLGDLVETENPHYRSMHARSVVGGFFMKILADKLRK